MRKAKYKGWTRLVGKSFIRNDSWNWDCSATVGHERGKDGNLYCAYTNEILATNKE